MCCGWMALPTPTQWLCWRNGWTASILTAWRRQAIWRSIWWTQPGPLSPSCPTPSVRTVSARDCWRAGWASSPTASPWAGCFPAPSTSSLRRDRIGPITGWRPLQSAPCAGCAPLLPCWYQGSILLWLPSIRRPSLQSWLCPLWPPNRRCLSPPSLRFSLCCWPLR